ncbi:hypothetical protein RR48_12849 [Papilio machaon]|uniref:Uncharacterized protein n=1 Tax=Papilio machaon TaxID=76193 RepID=A0A194QSY3_PAPMA|nr:hypothetical protein RR48_12849 [Papilio machaon]
MSEMYQEQHPLLCDDFSDDDFNCQSYSPRANIRMRPLVYSGRAKSQMKGAVTVMTRWPEHMWSTLKYWWMGIAMFGIIVLIVYNSVVAFSMLSLTYTKIGEPRLPYKAFENTVKDDTKLNVYMHIFANKYEEINLNTILPYVEIMSKKYQTLKFHLLAVINYTYKESDGMNDQSRNDLALESLWQDESFDINRKVVQNNLFLTYVSLSKYTSNPIMPKLNKNLSQDFTEFLVRALSIWEKGGVAFNPVILTPKTPNTIYLEQIQNILNKYKLYDNKKSESIINLNNHQGLHTKKKVNNIRDIIEALEAGDKSYNTTQYNLLEEENRVNLVSDKSFVINENISDPPLLLQTVHEIPNKKMKPIQQNKASDRFKKEIGGHHQHQLQMESKINLNNDTRPSLLPLFLEFLFPKRDIFISDDIRMRREKQNDKSNGSKNELESVYQPSDENDIHVAIENGNKQQDLISNYHTENCEHDTNTHLTIDLKGNVIASNTPCHAFVATLLKNAADHSEGETVSEYIIAQLTIFCKGVLFSSCKGIDVIL